MFGTIADWRAYALARGDTASTDASDDNATAALLRGSDHIQLKYVDNFQTPIVGLPSYVETAAYIAAGLELATPGFFMKTFTPSQQKVLTQAEGLKWTVVGNSTDAAPVSTAIELLLGKHLSFAGLYAGGITV